MQILHLYTHAVILDLPGVDNLRGADLRGADLSDADLSGADLRGADLRGANLTRADLSGADLRDANLRRANLTRADLSGADLDFSAWPLWCGGTRATLDRRLSLQLVYHAVNQQHTDPEVIAALEPLKALANKFRDEFRQDAPEVK